MIYCLAIAAINPFISLQNIVMFILQDVTQHLRTLKAKEDEFYRTEKFDQIYENTLWVL